MNAADLLVSEGYADLGYKYVIVDDCWLAKNRSQDGKLVADKKRFPGGIKALSDYVIRIITMRSFKTTVKNLFNFSIMVISGTGIILCRLVELH